LGGAKVSSRNVLGDENEAAGCWGKKWRGGREIEARSDGKKWPVFPRETLGANARAVCRTPLYWGKKARKELPLWAGDSGGKLARGSRGPQRERALPQRSLVGEEDCPLQMWEVHRKIHSISAIDLRLKGVQPAGDGTGASRKEIIESGNFRPKGLTEWHESPPKKPGLTHDDEEQAWQMPGGPGGPKKRTNLGKKKSAGTVFSQTNERPQAVSAEDGTRRQKRGGRTRAMGEKNH